MRVRGRVHARGLHPPTLPPRNRSGKEDTGGQRQNREHRRGFQADAGKGVRPYLEQQNELWEPLYGLHHQTVERDAVGAGLLALLWGEARLTRASGLRGPPPRSSRHNTDASAGPEPTPVFTQWTQCMQICCKILPTPGLHHTHACASESRARLHSMLYGPPLTARQGLSIYKRISTF